MFQRVFVIITILSFVSGGFSQATDAKKPTEDEQKLEKQAVEFLRDTAADVGNMRTMENRISFNSELASLMWFHDDKEAKAMFGGVVADFEQLLGQFDAQMNSLAVPATDDPYPSGGIFGGFGQSSVERKFRIAMAVRQQIAMSLAEHAPDIAYNFFYDSLSLISNPKFRKETEQSDKYFELQLMKQIADSNAAKAVEYGKESIKSGLDINHIELLKKIYSRDPDKGVDFGAAILSKIKSDRSAVKQLYFYGSLLSFGSDNLAASKKPGGKAAVYSAGDLRDIADLFAQKILEGGPEIESNSAISFAGQIDQYAPGRGAQIRAKYRDSKGFGTAVTGGNTSIAIARASNAAASATNIASNSGPNSEYQKAQRDREDREKAEKKMMDDIKDLGTKPLPKEARDKAIVQARKIISQTPGKDKKLAALSMLAAQVAKAGDKDLADEIMRDAERLINPQPKNYQDFLYSWMLAGGYAEANPDRAFPLLESTILRVNDTISAFVKVAEFIDVNEELIADGEVQVGMFGGSMIRGLTGELGMADSTIRSLAKFDFVKTKNLTNTFDRVEIRILAKMLVLRAVLDNRPKKDQVNDLMNGSEDSVVAAPAPPAPKRPN